MTKEIISNQYIGGWQERTQRYKPRFIQDRLALIVGYGHGNIGQAIGEQLNKDGMALLIPDESQFNVCRPHDVEKYLRRREDHPIDTMVLCNGMTHLDWFEDQPQWKMIETVGVNFTGSMLAAQSFVKHTIEDPWLKYIVFIGSMAHRNVLNASAPYCASKAGLAMLSRCLGWELAPKGYRVFCVHPSNTEGTPMTEETIQGIMRYRGIEREEAEAYWGAVRALPRWLQPQDIAETVSWLVSGNADFLTGTDIELTGGQR